MRIAIQEDMLAGKTTLERFEFARRLGLHGVECWGRGLTVRVPEIVEAVRQTGVRVSAVNHGRQGDLLHPDRPTREAALAELRQSIVDAIDIGAAGVVVVPHYGGPVLPDLTPYKSIMQLASELLHNHLRTLSDYVYALGTDLYLAPVNRYETHFMNTLAEAVRVRRKLKDHPHVKLAAGFFHMALEEADLPQTLRANLGDIGYIHAADSNRRLPGQGMVDWAAVADILHGGGYEGWVCLECGEPGNNQYYARQYADDLPACLAVLHRAGWTTLAR